MRPKLFAFSCYMKYSQTRQTEKQTERTCAGTKVPGRAESSFRAFQQSLYFDKNNQNLHCFVISQDHSMFA